jgi:predicted nucleic acid-binding protein
VIAKLQYLLDTNILSETRKMQTDERVISFLTAAEACILTLGESRKGVELKRRSDTDAAKKIANWVDGLEFSFVDRILHT